MFIRNDKKSLSNPYFFF